MSDNITELDSKRPHDNVKVRCMKCLHDWICVFPVGTDPYNLECPECHAQKSIPKLGNEITLVVPDGCGL